MQFGERTVQNQQAGAIHFLLYISDKSNVINLECIYGRQLI